MIFLPLLFYVSLFAIKLGVHQIIIAWPIVQLKRKQNSVNPVADLSFFTISNSPKNQLSSGNAYLK